MNSPAWFCVFLKFSMVHTPMKSRGNLPRDDGSDPKKGTKYHAWSSFVSISWNYEYIPLNGPVGIRRVKYRPYIFDSQGRSRLVESIKKYLLPTLSGWPMNRSISAVICTVYMHPLAYNEMTIQTCLKKESQRLEKGITIHDTKAATFGSVKSTFSVILFFERANGCLNFPVISRKTLHKQK